MSERKNRRELIIQTAGQLFAEHGYQATSTRQIAEAVGCTEAALYYHFKDGKRGLLHAVMAARMPEVQEVIERCSEAASLEEALVLFGVRFAERSPGMRWLMMEMPHLSENERARVLETLRSMREGLANTLRRFVADDVQAEQIAWLVLCIGAGYRQVFSDGAFAGTIEFSMPDLMTAFVSLMS